MEDGSVRRECSHTLKRSGGYPTSDVSMGVHCPDTIDIASEGVSEFMVDVLKLNPWDILCMFEQWACAQHKSKSTIYLTW